MINYNQLGENMSLDESLAKRKMLITKLNGYVIENRKELEKEYKINIPANISTMSDAMFSAWVQVYASQILLNKKVKKHLALKLFVKDYLLLNQEIARYDNGIIQ